MGIPAVLISPSESNTMQPMNEKGARPIVISAHSHFEWSEDEE